MSTPALSICIATLNRAKFLPATLDGLIAQLSPEVEICVLDGGSKDATEEILTGYAARHPQLRYIRQSTNMGLDQDFDRVIELARGEYCWLMADDDLLNPGGIAAVLQAIRRQPSLILVNAEVRNADMSGLLERSRLGFGEDQLYVPRDFSRLFAETASYLSFIGCVVIRRSVWLERNRQAYFGSLFIHMGVIFQQALPADAIVIAKPFIAIRYGVATWRSKEFEIWMFLWPKLVWSFDAVSEAARQSVSPREPWKEPARLLFYRAKGTYGMAEYRRWIRPRLSFGWRRVVAASISIVPGVLANALAVGACRLAPDRSGHGKSGNGPRLLDLRNSPFHIRNVFRRASGA